MLSTIHQAKGLEWRHVFVPRLIEESFPHRRALEEPGGDEEETAHFLRGDHAGDERTDPDVPGDNMHSPAEDRLSSPRPAAFSPRSTRCCWNGPRSRPGRTLELRGDRAKSVRVYRSSTEENRSSCEFEGFFPAPPL